MDNVPAIDRKPAPSVYGFCPKCSAPGATRERRPNGNDICVNGHTYPSRDAIPQAMSQSCATCAHFAPPTGKQKLGMCQWMGHEKLARELFSKLPSGVICSMNWRWPKIRPDYGAYCQHHLARGEE